MIPLTNKSEEYGGLWGSDPIMVDCETADAMKQLDDIPLLDNSAG